ncbi:MurR/RpiR family transcriptional regulator [Chelativorans sp. YIM 93263]|uniref:MurR/RpiR family transcriptional regulator n=1 Tax=Chelativorans sp. YIM 93263 TaxID=2906648 RepID=UPI0023790850|nr:MurR/RpiR family transcriptional regulator [Chelativorans sp. YIM 93263]
MNVLETLRRVQPELSSREARAARYLMANYPTAGLTTVAEFAEQSGVSTATVLRLVKRLGFPVYAEFQEALRTHIEETLQSPLLRFGERKEREETTQKSLLVRTSNRMAEHFRALPELISEKEFDRAATLLADPKRDIHLLGGRYSSHVARYMADLLMAVRGKVYPVNGQTQAWPQYLLDMGRGSVLVVLDVRRYQNDVVQFTHAAAKRGATVLLLTDIWQSPAARSADLVLTFPVESPSIFDVLSIGMGVAEALVGAVASKADHVGKRRIEALEELRSRLTDAAPPKAASNRKRNEGNDDTR